MSLQICDKFIHKFDISKYKRDVIEFGKNTEKICTHCKRKLSLDDFYDRTRKDRPGKIYKVPKCKECCIIENVRLQRHRRKKCQ